MNLGQPLLAGLGEMPFPALQSAFDPFTRQACSGTGADFFRTISDEAIDVHLKYGRTLPTGHSTMHMYPIDGAAARVASTPPPAHRRGWAGVIVGVDPDPENAGLITDWAKSYWEDLHPTSAGGAYINFMMDEGTDRARPSYLGNYERLARAKQRYDPTNLFHINQNIPPAGT